MAPTKSNAKNPCCLNLCNSAWFCFFMWLTTGLNLLWSFFGAYDTFWIWYRSWALEPTYVTAWNRLVGPAVGGDGVYGQILPRLKPLDYEKFYNDRTSCRWRRRLWTDPPKT